MSKVLRIFITFIGAVILLGLVSLIGLVVFVNPNDLKPQISQAVTKFTGRQLQLGGDIQWSLFPWLGLQLNDVKLTNSPDFGNNPFAQVKKLDIQVRLLPLLHKQLEIGKLQIHSLTLYLIKNAKGQVNWEGPFNSSQKTSPSSENNLNERFKPLGFIVTGLDIRDGHIIYADQQKNKHLEITQLQLKSANLAINKSSPFDVQFNLNSNAPINAAVKLRSSIKLSTDRKNIEFNNLNLNMLLKGPNYPKGELPVSLKSHIDLDLNKQDIAVNQLIAFVNQVKLTGHVAGQHILNNPNFSGALSSQQIKTGKLIFQQIKLNFQFKNNLLTLNPINAKLYQGNYQGNASINFNPKIPSITAQNQFNQINTELLFKDLINKSQIQLAGLATLNLNISTAGDNAEMLIRNLNGEGHFNLDQGALKGINLSYWIALGKALLKHEVTPKSTGQQDTPFDRFNGSFTINQGIVNNNDLIISSGRLRVNGRGVLNLPLQQINYELHAQPILADGSPEGIAIPIRISGPLQHISISPILDQLSVNIIKEKLKGRLGDSLKKLDLNKLFH